MINNYTFNETYKRFEPEENKCTYCDESLVENMDDCYFVPLFVTNDRTNIIIYRSVKFSKIEIGIPRCPSCKDIHENSIYKSRLITFCTVASISIFLICFFTSIHPFVFVGTLLAVIFGGIYWSSKLTDRYVNNEGIYTLQEGAETNEVVRELVISGWSFTHPSA